MANEIALCILVGLIIPFLWWSFTRLPREKGQIIATVPSRKTEDGLWQGTNLMYYDLFIANAQVFSVIVLTILMSSLGIGLPVILFVTAVLLSLCLAASKVIAVIVEKRANTFTVAGASFIGLFVAPFLLMLLNRTGHWALPVLPFLAAMSIGYVFGEGPWVLFHYMFF